MSWRSSSVAVTSVRRVIVWIYNEHGLVPVACFVSTRCQLGIAHENSTQKKNSSVME